MGDLSQKYSKGKKKFNIKPWLRTINVIIATVVIVAAITADWVEELDARVADELYQKSVEADSNILVIGIDSSTLNKLGPSSAWVRKETAKVIQYLNNNDPNARPAVIGIDVLFSGHKSDDADTDLALAEAAGQYGNVVMAAGAFITVGNSREETSNPYAIWEKSWPADFPYKELRESAAIGHYDAPNEKDGVARHNLLFVNIDGMGRLYSFGRTIYEKWCESRGISPNPPPVTKENGIYYLPFSAAKYSRGINFLDLAEGRVPSSVYRDKVILIGPYASGLMDDYPTALNRADKMYGIDIHANAIQAFERGFFPIEVEKTPQLIILLLIGATAEWFFRREATRNVALLWLIISVGWIGVCKLCYSLGFILHPLWVPLFVSVLFVSSVMSNYRMRAKEEETRVKTILTRYFDETVTEKLLSDNSDALKLGGKEQEVAVLFVDIRGFTAMCGELPDREIMEILNFYLETMTKCVRRYEGTIDKFIGDCAMAFWNAPYPQEDYVYLACRAAADMIAAAKDVNEKVKKIYNKEIAFGVGVHSGKALVGNIGSEFRMDYTAIGDTVNTAARLEENADRGQILISKDVKEKLGDRAIVSPAPKEKKLKGISPDFEIFVLDSLK